MEWWVFKRAHKPHAGKILQKHENIFLIIEYWYICGMIKLKIQKAGELDRNAKCTVHTTGKLGFSDGAIKKLTLQQGNYMVIATNEEDGSDDSLYAWIDTDAGSGGFKVAKAGEYFYVNTKPLFDKLGIDYANEDFITIYDVTDFEYEGQKIYKLKKRVQKRSKKKKNKTEADSSHTSV